MGAKNGDFLDEQLKMMALRTVNSSALQAQSRPTFSQQIRFKTLLANAPKTTKQASVLNSSEIPILEGEQLKGWEKYLNNCSWRYLNNSSS